MGRIKNPDTNPNAHIISVTPHLDVENESFTVETKNDYKVLPISTLPAFLNSAQLPPAMKEEIASLAKLECKDGKYTSIIPLEEVQGILSDELNKPPIERDMDVHYSVGSMSLGGDVTNVPAQPAALVPGIGALLASMSRGVAGGTNGQAAAAAEPDIADLLASMSLDGVGTNGQAAAAEPDIADLLASTSLDGDGTNNGQAEAAAATQPGTAADNRKKRPAPSSPKQEGSKKPKTTAAAAEVDPAKFATAKFATAGVQAIASAGGSAARSQTSGLDASRGLKPAASSPPRSPGARRMA